MVPDRVVHGLSGFSRPLGTRPRYTGKTCVGLVDPLSPPFDAGTVPSGTLLGGEPFDQAAPCAELAEAGQRAGLGVITFAGYELECLSERSESCRRLLAATDLLVDGPYRRREAETETEPRRLHQPTVSTSHGPMRRLRRHPPSRPSRHQDLPDHHCRRSPCYEVPTTPHPRPPRPLLDLSQHTDHN